MNGFPPYLGERRSFDRQIRVVIADDHPLVRAGIRTAIAHHPEIVIQGECASGDAVLETVLKHQPDVLILDLSMPGSSTAEIFRQMRLSAVRTQVLILTAHNDPDQVLAVLKDQAQGYVLKDEEPTSVVAAVRAVARGEMWISSAVTAILVDHTLRGRAVDEKPQLSAREIEVLHHLIKGKDNQEIGAVLSISERTVRFHLRNIYDKLGMRRGEVIAWGVRQGL